MSPLLEPETVATPLAKVMVVAVPKLTCAPVLSVTVGLLEPIEAAPEKVRLLSPV